MSGVHVALSTIRWGCLTVLAGPATLYSLMLAVSRWTPWDLTARPEVVEVLMLPYDVWMILLFPLIIAFGAWRELALWFGVIAAYFVAGALLRLGVRMLGARIDNWGKRATPSERTPSQGT
jgi:hypothetical protein